MGATVRWDVPWPAGTDNPGLRAHLQALAESVDSFAKDDQGVFASRPVSTPGSPGKFGRYYYATDVKILYRDHGTGWDAAGGPHELGFAQVTSNVNVDSLVTEAAPTTIITSPAIECDGVIPISVQFFCPRVVMVGKPATYSVGFNLWDASGDLGRLSSEEIYTGGLTTVSQTPAFAERRYIPTAGSKTFRIRAWCNYTSGTNVMIFNAGVGGAGLYLPMHIRVVR